MNISCNWLKDLIEIDLPAEYLADKLTRVGLAVEGVHLVEDDFVLDVDLTSNRPDCLSHLGIARELAAITDKELRVAASYVSDRVNEIPMPAALAGEVVRIEADDLCHRFTARIIRNVKVGPSPDWLIKRLEAIGERSINNVADITNYVMHELGQPMHSFDLDKLTGSRIVVRRARDGERLKTLDEVERMLDPEILVICDAESPVSIGGIMGGSGSGISDSTVNVLLEVAYFDRGNIRAASRKLGLATEASYRFERGVDINNIVPASNRATALICEFACGEAGELIDDYPNPHKPTTVVSRSISQAVSRLTGLEVDTVSCTAILGSIGIETDKNSTDAERFLIPSWRHDLSIEEDLVEEVVRHVGYENIAIELPPAYEAGDYQPFEASKKRLRQALVDIGFDEAISYSFIDIRQDDVFETVPGLHANNIEDRFVTLQDAVVEGAVRMRPSLLSGLLDAVRTNFNHQRKDIKFFEIGKVFAKSPVKGDTPNERELLALVLTGGELCADRAVPIRQFDFYDSKGALQSALGSAGVTKVEFRQHSVTHLQNGQSAVVSIGDQNIGYLGRINDVVAARYKFRQPVFVAEIDLQAALENTEAPSMYVPLAKFPEIVRDVSFLVKKTVTFDSIRQAIIDQGIDICRDVQFVDVFSGKGIADDERSITIRLNYRSDERTLLEVDVESIHKQIVEKVEDVLEVKLRL